MVVGTESVTQITKTSSGKIVISSSDPHDSSSPDDYVVNDTDVWSHFTNLVPSPTHVLGFIEIPNGDWFMCGSSPGVETQDGTVWRSIDQGTTWTEILRVPPLSMISPEEGDYRFYGFIPVENTWSIVGGATGSMEVDTHRTWTWDVDLEESVAIEDIAIPLTDPRINTGIAGRKSDQVGVYVLCMGPTTWPGFNDGSVWFFPIVDGVLVNTPTLVYAPASALCTDGDSGIYVTNYSSERIVRVTKSNATNVLVELSDVHPVSIAYCDGKLAVGGQSGNVVVVSNLGR